MPKLRTGLNHDPVSRNTVLSGSSGNTESSAGVGVFAVYSNRPNSKVPVPQYRIRYDRCSTSGIVHISS